MTPFKKGILLVFAAGVIAATTITFAYPQGAASLVQILLGGGGGVVSSSNPLPVSGTFSASFAGFPGTSQTTGTPISVTTSGVTGTLPSGTVVVATNVGTTNGAFCKLGASATTSDQYIAPNGGWFQFTVGSNTSITCITATSTTTVNLVGGSGLPTGTGGGSGGGSSSNASVSTTGSAVPGSATYLGINSGGNLTGWNGAVTNAGTFAVQAAQSGTWNITNISGTISLPTGAATAALQTTGNTALSTINTTLGSPFQAGGSIGNTSFAVTQATASNLNATVSQAGTWTVQPGNTANTTPWLFSASQGGNTAAVKAASTAPTATDPALVVAISPNSVNPNGQATATNSAPVVLPAAQVTTDPCSLLIKNGAPINLTASGQIITGTSGKKTYICSINLVSATAQNVALVEGTGTTCATNIYGLAGGTTAATGWNLLANSGLTEGAGIGTVVSPSGDTNATAANVCLLSSSTGQISGHITYVQQ